MPPKRKRESLKTPLRVIARSGTEDETLSSNNSTVADDEGNERVYDVTHQYDPTYNETYKKKRPKIEFLDDADIFHARTTWPLYQVTSFEPATIQPQTDWEKRLEGYRLKREHIVEQWRAALTEKESEIPSEEEIARMELNPDWHEPKICERIQPMTFTELSEIAQEAEVSLKLRKTSREKLNSLKSNGQQATLAQIPIEVGIDIVRYMINNWEARQTDLYDTLYQIRCTNVLHAAYCNLPQSERDLLPSSNAENRIKSFVTLHCNLTQAQLLGTLHELQLVWPGPGMVRWAGLPRESQTRMQQVLTPWFKVTLFILENNNIQHMSRLLLRDLRRESGEMWSVELRLPYAPPGVTAAPSIGRCINMGMFDEWLDLFDVSNIQDQRLHRNLRYNLWSCDRDTHSFSPRDYLRNNTAHAFSRGNSITEACLFESYAYRRYPHLDPRVRTDLTIAEAEARIIATGNIVDQQWRDFINNGR